MIDVREAVNIFKEKVPNKNIINVCEWKGKYVFSSRDKSLKDDETDWDSTCELVDMHTGEFSTMSWLDDIDLATNAKDIDWKE